MTTQSHIDFGLIGSFTLPDGSATTLWTDTGITIPDVDVEGLIAQVGSFRTTIFRTSRLTDLDRPTLPANANVEAERLPLSEIGVSGLLASSTYLGLSSTGTLLVAGSGLAVGRDVELFYLFPSAIDRLNLADTLLGALLPAATEQTRGYYVRQSRDGESFELVEDAPAPTGSNAAYATWTNYRDRGGTNADREDLITEILPAVSRLVDRRLNMMPGGFAPMAGETFYFNGRGKRRLHLRDSEGAVYPLRAVAADGIRPDYDRTGDFDDTRYQWDLDDAWIWGLPRNGAALGRPYRALELRRITSAPVTIWPFTDGGVRITGDWGWAATPGMIRELVVGWTRDTSDAHQGGAAATIQAIEEGVMLSGDSWRLWSKVQQEYGAGNLAGLGVTR